MTGHGIAGPGWLKQGKEMGLGLAWPGEAWRGGAGQDKARKFNLGTDMEPFTYIGGCIMLIIGLLILDVTYGG